MKTVHLDQLRPVAASVAKAWAAGDVALGRARPLARVIQTEIKDALSDQILFGQMQKGGEVHIDLKKDKLVFNYTAVARKPRVHQIQSAKAEAEVV